MPVSDDDVPGTVRAYLLSEERGTLAAVIDAADAVAAAWDGQSTADRDAVAPALSAELGRRGVVGRFPALLEGAAGAAGFSLPAPPVAAPPYAVVTSTGPVLRATLPGGRLVIAVRVFGVERGTPTRYRRRHDTPEDALDVAFHPRATG